MAVVFKNNASTTLNGAITNSATSITVTNGAVFPTVTARSAITAPVYGDGGFVNTKFLCHADVANGATTFTDVCGNTISNPSSYYSGNTTYYKFGTASAANSTASAVPQLTAQSTSFANVNGGFTMHMWINPSALSGTYYNLLGIKENGSNYIELQYPINSGTPTGYITCNGAWSGIAFSSSFAVNTWTLITLEYYGTTISVYQNGSRINQTTGTVSLTNPTISFGGNAGTIGWGYNSPPCRIDEMVFVNKPLYQGAVSFTLPTTVFTGEDPLQYSNSNSTTAGDYFYATITDGTNTEVVKVTNVSTNTLTVVRAQDGTGTLADTTGYAFASGSTIQIRPTNQGLIDLRNDQLFREVAYTKQQYLGAK